MRDRFTAFATFQGEDGDQLHGIRSDGTVCVLGHVEEYIEGGEEFAYFWPASHTNRQQVPFRGSVNDPVPSLGAAMEAGCGLFASLLAPERTTP